MKNTERFSDKVDNYVKYRPHYPELIVDCLVEHASLSRNSWLADIGAGTGISSVPFLKKGYQVIGVEPNKEMREIAEQLQQQYPNYKVINGSAETTGLGDRSIDIIMAGQAFHWFEPVRAKKEFQRIAKSGAFMALLWNERDTVHPFVKAYEQILAEFGTDYKESGQRMVRPEQFNGFFEDNNYQEFQYEHSQHFDFIGLKGRLLSSSYIPSSGPAYEPMLQKLKSVFDQYHQDGMVKFNYLTRLYLGLLDQD